LVFSSHAQFGCTDPQAQNFNIAASQNDGSCLYNPTNYSLQWRDSLPSLLNEISGMVYWQGKLYVHNDSGTPNHMYEIDTTHGLVTKTIILGNIVPNDWEDITQDSLHFYIADVGNNLGTRTDLVVYKFPKSSVDTGLICTIPDSVIEAIHFVYPDQTSFSANTNTPFDCEAIAFKNQKLHLFTKNWTGISSVHYTIPITAGSYTAIRLDSVTTNGFLITGADFAENAQLMLVGYKVTFPAECAFWYCYDFPNSDECFDKGNKRQIDLGNALTLGQIEGVCFKDTNGGFVSNERFNPSLSFNFPNQFYRFGTSQWYPYMQQTGLDQVNQSFSPFVIRSNALGFEIDCFLPKSQRINHQIFDLNGRKLYSKAIQYNVMYNHYSLDYLMQNKGLYILQIIDEEGKTYNLKINL
jgi:hypothetical protein